MANRHMKIHSIANNQGNASQNHNEILLHTCQNGHHQKEHKKYWRGCIEKGISYTSSGNINHCIHNGKQYQRFLKNLDIQLPYDPMIPEYIAKRKKNTDLKR